MTNFLNSKDKEVLRDHLLHIIEVAQQGLKILLEEDDPEAQRVLRSPRGAPEPQNIPEGPWKRDQATPKQLAVLDKGKVEYWDGITKGEASELISNLFKKVGP